MLTHKARFFLTFDANYLMMATSIVRSLTVFHPGYPIVVYTHDEDIQTLTTWAQVQGFHDLTVMPYHPTTELSFGEWHPLIWAKLEAFAADPDVLQIVLDVDQILYRDLTACIEEAISSDKVISASPDIYDLRGQVLESFDGGLELASLANVQCFNAGAMIVRPSKSSYEELVALAVRHHQDVRLPEQAILNVWAREHGEHHDLGDKFMLQPLSPKLLEEQIPSCLVHFWTPRPAFFGVNPIRSSEPDWESCLKRFQEETGKDYPLERFEHDFLARLHGTFRLRAGG